MKKDTSPPSPSVRTPESPLRGHADGHADGLEPVLPLDIHRIETVRDMVEQMADLSFGARRVGEAADLLYTMAADEDCFVVLTVTGAMTVAKLTLLMVDMIEQGLVHAVVATGALIAHGVVEGQGRSHFKVPPGYDDEALFQKGYDRVYDTLETEENLMTAEELLRRVLETHDPAVPLSSRALARMIGEELCATVEGRGILQAAAAHDVPVYIPALSDSVMGLDFHLTNKLRQARGEPPFRYDALLDLEDFARRIEIQRRTALFTIGGGVPRNWAQQVSPYLDYEAQRLRGENSLHRYRYGVRICPDPVHFGHLSGCTYSESVSWGKLVPLSEGGRWVEVPADATVVWPMVVKAATERLQAEGRLPVRKDLPRPEQEL